jgi:hypothetical protein
VKSELNTGRSRKLSGDRTKVRGQISTTRLSFHYFFPSNGVLLCRMQAHLVLS